MWLLNRLTHSIDFFPLLFQGSAMDVIDSFLSALSGVNITDDFHTNS